MMIGRQILWRETPRAHSKGRPPKRAPYPFSKSGSGNAMLLAIRRASSSVSSGAPFTSVRFRACSMDFAAHTDNLDSRSDNAEIAETGLSVTVEVVMGSYKSVFDPLDFEIIDRVYEVAWASSSRALPRCRIGWRTPGGATQKDLRRGTYLRPRTMTSTLLEMVLAAIPEQLEPEPSPRVGSNGGYHQRPRQ